MWGAVVLPRYVLMIYQQAANGSTSRETSLENEKVNILIVDWDSPNDADNPWVVLISWAHKAPD